MSEPAMTAQQSRYTKPTVSALNLYRELAVGEGQSFPHFLHYEIAMLIAQGLPGLLGLGLRNLLYRSLVKEVQGRIAFGRGVTLRHPRKISIGRGVLVDDYAALDIRGKDASIILGDHAVIGRFTTIAAKEAHIHLKNGVNVGSYCRIASQSRVEIGESTLIAAFCYIGPGNHRVGDQEKPLISADMDIKGGVFIGDHAWIGAHTTIMDGVKIGSRAIVGAHSLVKEDVPEGAVVAGTPARLIRG